MVELLRHRGPDDEGIHVDGPLGLAHTRLSILDTTDAGHQPMSYAGGRYHWVYNGEIYNFIELRNPARARSPLPDRERHRGGVGRLRGVGRGVRHRFNGMWGLAIFDRSERRLFPAPPGASVDSAHDSWDEDALWDFDQVPSGG